MNKVILTGSVVGTSTRKDGVLRFKLAGAYLPQDTTRPIKPINLHHKVAVPGHLGEVTTQYAKSGQALYVEGHLEDGTVMADQVFLMGGSSLPGLLQS